ncbi:MAG: tetratricopeptide repeat protein [Nitrospinae bacterium]|nr:tetratricopeptide repeat protein [Nitrospinota bacterium]
MRTFESTREVSSLGIGLTIFESLLQQNAADKNYILIHTAYFYEHIEHPEKADECIKMALHFSTDTPVIIEKIGNFYRHLAEKQFKNPVERAAFVFQALTENANYKEIIDQQLKTIEIKVIYEQLKILTGNDAQHLASRIMDNAEILFRLRDLIDSLLDGMRQLVKDKQIKADAGYFDGVIRKSMANASKEFRKKRGETELSNECTLLRIKCSEILSIKRGEADINNFTNFYDMANDLNAAKEQNLHLLDDAKKYYENYEAYIEKAILLGEEAIKNTKPQDRNGPKFYSSLADAYHLRGNLKREKKQPSSEDYQRGIELFKALGDVVYTNKKYLDWDVERLAECYFFRSDYKSAIKEYEILFEKSDTKKYQAALGLGNVHDAMGEFLSAKVWYLECLKISKSDPAAYDKLIHLHRKHGYYEDTIEWQKKMIEIRLGDLDFQYFRLGILYEEKGNVEEAIKIFRYIVTERQPDSLRSLDHLISLLMLKEESEDYQEAIKWLGKKIELSTKLVWDYCRLGDCYLSLNNDSTAFEYYEKALAIDPTALSSLQRIAKWHELKEQYSKSVELVKKMIEIVGDEKSDGHYKWLGDLYWKLKDKGPAIDAYYNSLRIKPEQTEIYDRIGKNTGIVPTQFLIERVSELESQYEKSPSPDLATEIVTRYISIQDEQHANKAFKFLPKSVYKPESYDYYEKSAKIYENLKQYDSAIKTRQKINALDSLEPYLRLRNLRAIAELISGKRLYRHYHIKLNCVKEMEDFIEKAIPDEIFTEEIDVDKEEKIQEAIYTFRYEMHYLANHYSTNGYYSRAHGYVRRLLRCRKYNLQNDRVYLQTEANIFFAENRFDDAEKVANRIIRIEGEDSHALFLLGKIFKRKKEFLKAIEYFERSYKASNGRVDALDQIGATYREWAKESTLTEPEKAEIKQKATKCYESILNQQPDNRFTLYGLAKSYLLEPLTNGYIYKAKQCLIGILKSDIGSKSHISHKDIDCKVIKELLYLWAKHYDDTIAKILSGKSQLIEHLDTFTHSFIAKEIVEIAKGENIFSQHIVDKFKNVFSENQSKGIRKTICQYLMKHIIFRCYQSASLGELQTLIKEAVELILMPAYKKRKAQGDAVEYLSEFLGSEMLSYLEFLGDKTYIEIRELEDLVWALDEEKSDSVFQTAPLIKQKLPYLKDKLDDISFSFTETVDIYGILREKQRTYLNRLGENITLIANIPEIKDVYVSQTAWKKVDDFIFEIIDTPKKSGISGLYKLIAEHDRQIVSLSVIAEFQDSQEERAIIISDIKGIFQKKYPELYNKGVKVSFKSHADGFSIGIPFERKERFLEPFKFNDILNFLESCYPLPPARISEVYKYIERDIRLEELNIQEKIVSHLLSQVGTLLSKAKNKFNLFLKEPHELPKLINPKLTHDEMRIKIRNIKETFRNRFFFLRSFRYSETEKEEEVFSLDKAIKAIADTVVEYRHIPIRNLQVNTTFEVEKDKIFLFRGYREHIEYIIRNLLSNAYKAIDEKLRHTTFKPEIKISLHKEGKNYEILFSDNGIGMPSGYKVKDLMINSKQRTGTGIGLNIIQQIVNHYRGEFEIFKSENGAGAAFIIKLPVPKEE